MRLMRELVIDLDEQVYAEIVADAKQLNMTPEELIVHFLASEFMPENA